MALAAGICYWRPKKSTYA